MKKAIPPYTIILFYKFISIKNPEKLKKDQKALCESLNLKGRFLIAEEGINSTLEGKTEDIKKYMRALHAQPRFKDILFKKSAGIGNAFSKLQVKIRPEVVTLGVGKLNIKKDTAKALTPTELEKLYKTDKDFVVLDLRNDFEVEAGRFERTIDPKLKNFRDLPSKLSELKELKNKKIVTVCTGGIRCEKATCYLKEKGFNNLYQLKDGIHTYMEKYPNKHFKGSLFVFDNRVVTEVVDTPDREIVGHCSYCGKPSEDFYNDDSTRPSTKVIACTKCSRAHKKELRPYVSA